MWSELPSILIITIKFYFVYLCVYRAPKWQCFLVTKVCLYCVNAVRSCCFKPQTIFYQWKNVRWYTVCPWECLVGKSWKILPGKGQKIFIERLNEEKLQLVYLKYFKRFLSGLLAAVCCSYTWMRDRLVHTQKLKGKQVAIVLLFTLPILKLL